MQAGMDDPGHRPTSDLSARALLATGTLLVAVVAILAALAFAI